MSSVLLQGFLVCSETTLEHQIEAPTSHKAGQRTPKAHCTSHPLLSASELGLCVSVDRNPPNPTTLRAKRVQSPCVVAFCSRPLSAGQRLPGESEKQRRDVPGF